MTLGQVLKNRRNELGKSIEQIATATRIHVKVLQALENDEYAHLPARAFTRGFIITYCKSLQLNPDEILSSYHDFLNSKFSERPERDQGHQGYAFEGKESEQQKRGMIIIASFAAFFAILTLLFFKPQNHKHREKHKELMTEEVDGQNPGSDQESKPDMSPVDSAGAIAATASEASPAPSAMATLASTSPIQQVAMVATTSATPAPTATPTPTPTAVAAASPSPTDSMNKGDLLKPLEVGVKLNLQAIEDVVVKYQSDQRPTFSLNLRKDRQLVIKASQSIHFETSHPELLKYKVKNKKTTESTYMELKEKSLELRAE